MSRRKYSGLSKTQFKKANARKGYFDGRGPQKPAKGKAITNRPRKT